MARAKPLYRPNLFVNTETAEDEARTNPFYSIIEKYSLTPKSFIARDLNTQETARTSIVKAREEVQSKIKELTAKVARYEGLLSDFMASAKDVFQSVVEGGKFTKPTEDLTALGREGVLPQISDCTSYLNELERYETFVRENGSLFLSHKDIYRNDTGSSVTRFGINAADLTDSQIQELVDIQQNIGKEAKEEPAQKEEAVSVKSSPKKGGAGSVKSSNRSDTKSPKDPSTQKLLHPLEIFVIQEAIKSLMSAGMPGADASDNPASAGGAGSKDRAPASNKVVLVDIFPRDKLGNIEIKDLKLEAHTIVLYLQETTPGQKQILVIDPSSSDFSKHVAANAIRILGSDSNNIEILVPIKQLKIYASPDKDNVGSASIQYRDCIDIAVKIAFGLSKFHGVLDINDLKSLKVVQEITNQQESGNDHLFFKADEASARIRQASSDGIREQVNKLLIDLDNKTQAISKYFKSLPALQIEVDAKLRKDNLKTFQESHKWDEYNEGVQNLEKLLYRQAVYFSGKIMENAPTIPQEEAALQGDVQPDD